MSVSEKAPSSSITFEPHFSYQVLRGCNATLADGERCGEKHPLAHNPPLNTMLCPKCGAPVAAPEPSIEVETLGERVYNILRSLVT